METYFPNIFSKHFLFKFIFFYQASCREEHPPDRRDRVLHCQCECHRAAEAREPHHVQVLLIGGFEFLMNLLFLLLIWETHVHRQLLPLPAAQVGQLAQGEDEGRPG